MRHALAPALLTAALLITPAAAATDNPAPADWNTKAADNTGAPARAFDRDTGRTGWFGKAWFDVDGNGCDTRNDVLARDLTDITFKDGSTCTIATGRLADPYTGKTIDFTRGKETSQAVQIDHVIPLGYAYAHGAWAWDATKRLAFANDMDNLLAVDGPANSSKSDRLLATSPTGTSARDTWDPVGGDGWSVPNADYTCTYAEKIEAVATKYDLGLADADQTALTQALAACEKGTGAVSPTATPSEQPATVTDPTAQDSAEPSQAPSTQPSAVAMPTGTSSPSASTDGLGGELARTGAAVGVAIGLAAALATAGVLLVRRSQR